MSIEWRNIRKACEHERYDQHALGVTVLNQSRQWEIRPEGGGWCLGGSSVTIEDLLGDIETQLLIDELVKRREWPFGIAPRPVQEDSLLIREEQ